MDAAPSPRSTALPPPGHSKPPLGGERRRGTPASPAPDPLTQADVVVIDEVGMVSTRSLLRLVEQSQAAGAKVVLVGDPRQLPELEAGGAFATLIERHDDAKLQTNRRQIEPWALLSFTLSGR